MSLNDGEGGDIGFLYYNNLETENMTLKDLPTLEEKLKFSEFKGMTILRKLWIENVQEVDVTVRPGQEVLYLMKKTGTE